MNTREIYKLSKYKIRTNIDFCLLYGNKLVVIERLFLKVISEHFKRSGVVSKKKQFFNFSMGLNNFLIGFYCKTNLEPRYLAVFLKTFENFFFNSINS